MFVKLVENEKLVYIRKCDTPAAREIEISAEEFELLSVDIVETNRKVNDYYEQLLNGKISFEDIPEKYLDKVAEKYRDHAIADYVKKIKAGEMTLEEVPIKYRAEVAESVKQAEPNNPHGISNELYDTIRDEAVAQIEREVAGNANTETA